VGYISQNDLRVHFGLGAVTSVDRIVIRWPNGQIEEAPTLAADRFYLAREGNGIRPTIP
jgi:hypothetical protein